MLSFSQNPTTDKVLDGIGTEVTALHGDTKEAISTLHQDAQAVIQTAYTDGKSLLGVAYEDINKIIKYATPKLEAGLIALAQTLKTTVAEVYRVLIMKQIAIATSYALLGLFASLFAYFTYRIFSMPETKLYNANVDYTGKRWWKMQWIITLPVTAVASISMFIVFFSHFQEMCIGFIAPQAGAIKEIVQMVDTLLK